MREVQDGDFPFADEWNALAVDALQGTCVVSGCAVSDGGTEDFALDVASGTVAIDGTDYAVGAQSVTLADADPDDPRYDVVAVGTDGAAEVVTGTASATPQAPPIPDGHALLAIVGVAAGASGVTDADVFDARVVLAGAYVDAQTVDADDVTASGSFTDPSGRTYSGVVGPTADERALWYAGL